MKIIAFTGIVLLSIFGIIYAFPGHCVEHVQKHASAEVRDSTAGDTVWGDFNGDGKKEYLWALCARDTVFHCMDNCSAKVKCSDKRIPVLDTREDIWEAGLFNEGDLDGDGRDDISLAGFNEGSWGGCYVYTFKRGKWIKAIPSFSIWDGLGQENVKKDTTRKGYVIYTEWFGGDSIYTVTKSIKMK
ncbi:MAG TPA: hypothetical protein VI112_01200 [Bacteroidia bacterium]|jgi:hypothetical protein